MAEICDTINLDDSCYMNHVYFRYFMEPTKLFLVCVGQKPKGLVIAHGLQIMDM